MNAKSHAKQRDDQIYIGKLEGALDALSTGIAIADSSGAFVYGNPAYFDLLFDPGEHPKRGENSLTVARRVVDGSRVIGLDQMDPDHAVLMILIDLFSFAQNAELSMKDGRVFEFSTMPTAEGGYVTTFHETGENQLGQRRAAEVLKNAFGSAEMGMILWDSSLSVHMVNSAWQDLVVPANIGTDAGAMLKTLCGGGVLPNETDRTDAEFVRRCLSDMHRTPMQYTLAQPDGRIVQLSTFGTSTGGVIATAVDVTEQHDAQNRARRMLNDALEALDVGLLHFDAELKLLTMNAAANRIVMDGRGRMPEGTPIDVIVADLVGQGDLVIPDGQSEEEAVQGFVSSVRGCESGRRPLWKDGRTLEFNADLTQMGGYLISVYDLTEATEAAREAEEAHELVRTIFDASPTTFLVSKLDSAEVVYATEASRQRFGNIANTLSFFLDPKDRTTYLEALLRTGELNDYPVRFRRRDGSIMDGLTSARVISYQGERMIVSSTRDVTDFLAMQRELEAQRKTALQNEKLSALGELLAGVAHELSNPLSVVSGYAMMLRQTMSDDRHVQKLDRIELAAERCVRIVKMFLALARERPATIELCHVKDLVGAAVTGSSGGIDQLECAFEIEIPADIPMIHVDPDHLTQVISNLVVNAQHAVSDLGPNGHITVRARSETDRLILEVQDNGPGIPAEIQTRIFEPFFTTKDVGSGIGVGLAFSHRVITAHEGTLTVHAAEGGGALFRISLPFGAAYDLRDATRPEANATSSIARILVLDDDLDVLRLLQDLLDGAGHDVVATSSPKQALDLCDQARFDVILSDMRMAEMTGEAFFEALRARDADQARRVMFLTGDTMNADLAAVSARTHCPVLEKPIVGQDLLLQIQALMQGATK